MRYYNLDMDTTLGGVNASNTVLPSQKAIKTYVDERELNDLADVIIGDEDLSGEPLSDGQILIYDEESGFWINKSKQSAIIRDWN